VMTTDDATMRRAPCSSMEALAHLRRTSVGSEPDRVASGIGALALD
jgi:hypothetical protein